MIFVPRNEFIDDAEADFKANVKPLTGKYLVKEARPKGKLTGWFIGTEEELENAG
jgi:hypothetical protein